MKTKLIILFLAFGLVSIGQTLPEGVKMDTIHCTYAKGESRNNFYKNNEMIGVVTPASCFYSETEGGGIEPYFFAEFYMASRKDTFATKKAAIDWIVMTMGEFYKPVVVTKWQNLMVQPPKVRLKYPWDWTYRLEKYDGIFNSKSLSENKLVLGLKDQRGTSEVMMIIRTPNTARLNTSQVMEMTAMMNRAIDLKNGSAASIVIGGKSFKSSQNTFMIQMNQWHFWYADEEEIIYINYNLLKDERTWYPEVMKKIVESITW